MTYLIWNYKRKLKMDPEKREDKESLEARKKILRQFHRNLIQRHNGKHL